MWVDGAEGWVGWMDFEPGYIQKWSKCTVRLSAFSLITFELDHIKSVSFSHEFHENTRRDAVMTAL